jgi:hypothetical protein
MICHGEKDNNEVWDMTDATKRGNLIYLGCVLRFLALASHGYVTVKTETYWHGEYPDKESKPAL